MFILGERRFGGKIFQILKGCQAAAERKVITRLCAWVSMHWNCPVLILREVVPSLLIFPFLTKGWWWCVIINLLSYNLTRRRRVLLHLAASLQFDLFCGSGV